MIRSIVKDVIFLQQKSEPAGMNDLQTAVDLRDTLLFYREHCVGMAANMIGVRKNIIAVFAQSGCQVMLNPVILKKSKPYEAKEGCLCLEGLRPAIRYRIITLQYQDLSMHKHVETYEGLTAEIIQHECDHLAGRLI